MFNLSSWVFLAQQPMPSISTIKGIIEASYGLFSFYTDDKHMFDWKFPNKVNNIIPYHKAWQQPYELISED